MSDDIIRVMQNVKTYIKASELNVDEMNRLETLEKHVSTALGDEVIPEDLDDQLNPVDFLTKAEIAFEESHPTLSGLIRQLINNLNDMGI